MPRKIDFVSVKVYGRYVHVQKYLILNTLMEVYVLFKVLFPDNTRIIVFFKFCELYPEHSKLPGSNSMHSCSNDACM